MTWNDVGAALGRSALSHATELGEIVRVNLLKPLTIC